MKLTLTLRQTNSDQIEDTEELQSRIWKTMRLGMGLPLPLRPQESDFAFLMEITKRPIRNEPERRQDDGLPHGMFMALRFTSTEATTANILRSLPPEYERGGTWKEGLELWRLHREMCRDSRDALMYAQRQTLPVACLGTILSIGNDSYTVILQGPKSGPAFKFWPIDKPLGKVYCLLRSIYNR